MAASDSYKNKIKLTPAEAFQWLEEEAVLLDLRRPYETAFRTLDVPETVFLPWKGLDEHHPEIPHDRPVILVCNSGVWSGRLYDRLKAAGVGTLAIISGGVLAWVEDGMPICSDSSYALSGQCSCKLRPRKPYAKNGRRAGGK